LNKTKTIFTNAPIFFTLLLAFMLIGLPLYSQVQKVHIKSIQISGIKKTKKIAVLRYLNIKEGDSLSLEKLLPKIEENTKLVMNSKLFTDAQLKIVNWNNADIELLLQVHESWYVFPFPIVELADRNFNVWWKEFDRDVRRMNLGLAVFWRNTFGFNDKMRFNIQFGFTRKFDIAYQIPALGKKQKWGLYFDVHYSDNKESAFNTAGNKLLFYRDLESKTPQFTQFKSTVELNYRRTNYENHYFSIQFLKLQISDSIFARNPDFFLDGRKTQKSFTFNYELVRDKRDVQTYPLKGYYFSFLIKKRGLGIYNDINQLWFTCNSSYYHKFGKKWSVGLVAEGRISALNHKDPYYQQGALGFNESYVRGFQYYVINGQNYFLFKSDLNFKILEYKMPLFPKSEQLYTKFLPIHLHARVHSDYGYVSDRYYYNNNPLSNRHLASAGVGLDLALYYYNIVIQTEYTVNNLWEKDLYLRFKVEF
jgi:outer membrane protein assembly factor BamA